MLRELKCHRFFLTLLPLRILSVSTPATRQQEHPQIQLLDSMRYNTFVAGLLAVTGGSIVSAATTYHIESEVVEQLHNVPEGWSEVGVPDPEQKLRFRIALRSVSNFFFPPIRIL